MLLHTCLNVLANATRQQRHGITLCSALCFLRTVVNADGSPALGPDRPTSGVCGAPIRQAALDFVRTARDVIDTKQLGLTLVGVGGVSSGQHVLDMLDAGADFVQVSSAACKP